MADIRHRIGVAAHPAAVYEELAATEGLGRWWTHDVRGRAAIGEEMAFHFGAPERFMVMEVTELRPNERVAWRCVDGPDEWVGTDLTFDVRPGDDETLVLFTHEGWREPVEFLHHCSTKWASYLFSLKAGLESGQARPFPDDVKVSGWD